MDQALADALHDARRRLLAKRLCRDEAQAVSVRGSSDAPLHAAIYRLRPDVGAIAEHAGAFARLLHGLGGVLPILFDEQARHLGRMGTPAVDASDAALAAALREGGNALLVAGVPLCLGATCRRMVFNAELFEKCAMAHVLAASTGQPVSPLPWWVGHIANGRLMKDERRAAQRFARGLLPEEVHGY